MKVIIAGSRTFNDYKNLCKTCENILQDQNNIEIVSGSYNKRADKLGEQCAKEREYLLKQFPANWNKFGRAAGPKRNEELTNYADALIAFRVGKVKIKK